MNVGKSKLSVKLFNGKLVSFNNKYPKFDYLPNVVYCKVELISGHSHRFFNSVYYAQNESKCTTMAKAKNKVKSDKSKAQKIVDVFALCFGAVCAVFGKPNKKLHVLASEGKVNKTAQSNTLYAVGYLSGMTYDEVVKVTNTYTNAHCTAKLDTGYVVDCVQVSTASDGSKAVKVNRNNYAEKAKFGFWYEFNSDVNFKWSKSVKRNLNSDYTIALVDELNSINKGVKGRKQVTHKQLVERVEAFQPAA